MRDEIVFAAVVASFASLATAHAAIVWGLFARHRRRRAAVALFVPPAAPWWAMRERMRVRAVVWIATAAAYVAALVVSAR